MTKAAAHTWGAVHGSLASTATCIESCIPLFSPPPPALSCCYRLQMPAGQTLSLLLFAASCFLSCPTPMAPPAVCQLTTSCHQREHRRCRCNCLESTAAAAATCHACKPPSCSSTPTCCFVLRCCGRPSAAECRPLLPPPSSSSPAPPPPKWYCCTISSSRLSSRSPSSSTGRLFSSSSSSSDLQQHRNCPDDPSPLQGQLCLNQLLHWQPQKVAATVHQPPARHQKRAAELERSNSSKSCRQPGLWGSQPTGSQDHQSPACGDRYIQAGCAGKSPHTGSTGRSCASVWSTNST